MSRNRAAWPWLFALGLLGLLALLVWWLALREDDIDYRGPPIRIGAGVVPERELTLMESAPGEGRDAFLKRVGRVLVEHSQLTGHEACGQVCQNRDSSRFAVQVVTNDAHIMCAMWTTCPEGYMLTGSSIHSHCPAKRMLRANGADMAMSGNRYKLGDRLKGCDDRRFSDLDIASGPGYLATPDGLLFQQGRGTVANLGPLADQAAAVVALGTQDDAGATAAEAARQ